MIVNLSLQRKVTTGPQIVETGPQREHWIRQVIKGAEVTSNSSGRLNVSALAMRNSALTPAISDRKNTDH